MKGLVPFGHHHFTFGKEDAVASGHVPPSNRWMAFALVLKQMSKRPQLLLFDGPKAILAASPVA